MKADAYDADPKRGTQLWKSMWYFTKMISYACYLSD